VTSREKVVLVAGPVFVDSIFSGLPAMPELGKEVYGDHYLVTIGGCAITAIGLARLGISAEIATAIGGDLFGTFLEDRLAKEGVSDRGLVKIESEHTNATTAMVYAGDRAFVSYSGAELPESELIRRMSRTGELRDSFAGVSHLHLGLRLDPGLNSVLLAAREKKVTTSLVCGWDGVEYYGDKPELMGSILSNTDFFFCNQLEAETISKQASIDDAVAFFARYGCHPVITRGGEGAVTLDENGDLIKVPALQVDFLDATGAGDSFAAGFIAGHILGYELSKNLQLAAVCGSLSTTALGGTEGFPKTLSEALQHLGELRMEEQD